MAKKKKCPECPAGEKWAVPYADFLSLLLALFIALYAISASNTEKVKALKEEFVKIFDYAPRPEHFQPIIPMIPNPKDTSDEAKGKYEGGNLTEREVQGSITEAINQGGVLEQVDEGALLKLPASILFPINSAQLEDQDSLLFLKRISQITHKLPRDVQIDVRGFAKNPNIQNTKYKNDYELGAARALYVLDFLIKDGISPEQILFSSQGKYGKEAQGSTEQERLAKSNRVEIYFFVKDDQSQRTKQLLEEIAKALKS